MSLESELKMLPKRENITRRCFKFIKTKWICYSRGTKIKTSRGYILR